MLKPALSELLVVSRITFPRSKDPFDNFHKECISVLVKMLKNVFQIVFVLASEVYVLSSLKMCARPHGLRVIDC